MAILESVDLSNAIANLSEQFGSKRVRTCGPRRNAINFF